MSVASNDAICGKKKLNLTRDRKEGRYTVVCLTLPHRIGVTLRCYQSSLASCNLRGVPCKLWDFELRLMDTNIECGVERRN